MIARTLLPLACALGLLLPALAVQDAKLTPKSLDAALSARVVRVSALRGVVVGAGYLGPFWVRELVESPNTEIVGWVDLDSARVRAAAQAAGLDGLPTGDALGRMLIDQTLTSSSTSRLRARTTRSRSPRSPTAPRC